ncbi:ANKZF1 [Bugula neritina]|uniref:ANKZF1 n=1 Tax=Bugula neritina TaxID=10212 RepID=A0A7J7JVK9_BUGNE|nr:ANKZF1 [Bugula neritina]
MLVATRWQSCGCWLPDFLLTENQKPSVLEKTKKKLVSKRGPSLERRRRQGHPTDEINADAECKLPSEEEVEDSVVLVDTAYADDLKGETFKHRKSVKEKDLSVPAQNKMLAFQSEFYTACTVGDKVELERLITGYSNEILQGLDNFSAAISLPLNSQGHTLLHIACQKCHSHLIPYLLGIGCDPAKPDEKNVVPYLSTQNKAVRNEFRIFMESFPEKYDYIKAQVPGPLTREMVALKDSKDSERRKELNKKKKDRLKVKKAEAAAQRAEDEEKARFLALSDREKRALAAERRLLQAAGTQSKVPQVLNRCHHCAKDITGKTPFEYLNYTFCSPQCLKLHRQAQKEYYYVSILISNNHKKIMFIAMQHDIIHLF